MSRTLLLAIGLAAIDGVMCAFIAVLALALLLQQDAVASAGSAEVALVEIGFLKQPVKTMDPVTMQLIARANIDGCGGSKWLINNEEWLCPNGPRMMWRDCQTKSGQCKARLVVMGLSKEAKVSVEVLPSDDAGNGGVGLQERIRIQPSLYSGSGDPDESRRHKEMQLGDIDGLKVELNVDRVGGMSLSRNN